jgi:hypothetical protein
MPTCDFAQVEDLAGHDARWWDFFCGHSSPKRNRLGQCLLGSKESQKVLLFVVDL